MASLLKAQFFSWELSYHLLSLKRWNHGLVKKANWHLCLFIKSTDSMDLWVLWPPCSTPALICPWWTAIWVSLTSLIPELCWHGLQTPSSYLSLVSQGFLFCWIDANLSHCSLYPYDHYSGQHTLTTWQWVLAPTRARRPAIGSCKSRHCDFYFQTPVINNWLPQQLRVNPQRRPGILIHRVLYQRTRIMFPNMRPGCRE